MPNPCQTHAKPTHYLSLPLITAHYRSLPLITSHITARMTTHRSPFLTHLACHSLPVRATWDSIWIIKPAAAYCGKGIFLHRSSDELPDHVRQHRGVACRYLDNPFLLDGLKSDIRLYVLVTCWHPLTVYLYEDGLARFATEPYSNDTIDQRCAQCAAATPNPTDASWWLAAATENPRTQLVTFTSASEPR